MIMRSLTPRLHQQHTNGQSHVPTGVQAGVQAEVQTGVQAGAQAQEKTREKTREKILALIAADSSITTAELANRIGITAKGVEWQIGKLKQKGFLERICPAKGGHWKVVETKNE